MSKEKEKLREGIEDVLGGWSIGANAKKEVIEKYGKPKGTEPKPAFQKPAPQPQKKVDLEALKGFMFTKAEERVYDVLVKHVDLHSITSPLSYQNIQDTFKKDSKPVSIKTISRCIKSLLSKGLIKIDTQPVSTAGTRYNVTELKDYLSQLLPKEEQKG